MKTSLGTLCSEVTAYQRRETHTLHTLCTAVQYSYLILVSYVSTSVLLDNNTTAALVLVDEITPEGLGFFPRNTHTYYSRVLFFQQQQ